MSVKDSKGESVSGRNDATRPSSSADDPRERVVFHRSHLVLDDGHPTNPKSINGQELRVTVTAPREQTWWMRLLGVHRLKCVVIDVRVPDADWFVDHGSLTPGGETSFTIRSVDI